MPDRLVVRRAAWVLIALFLSLPASAAESLRFDVVDTATTVQSESREAAIAPWKVVTLDPEYGGLWVLLADLDGDGEVEVVSCENVNVKDVHYTSTAVAQKLDGTVLWSWGNPDPGRKTWHHDVACQVHDWDGDEHPEVVLLTQGALVELDGATGREKRRIAIPETATDCLVFCDLSGKGRATDVLVKNRYTDIHAYNYEGRPIWSSHRPGGYRTAHQPFPMDIDGDGRDEIMAGFAMLNCDGSLRWTFRSEAADLSRGHLDACRVVRSASRPEDWRLALTCCGAQNLAMIDGAGRVIWERPGAHYESMDIGRFIPDLPGMQIVCDIDHEPKGESPLVVLDETGRMVGRFMLFYGRQHRLLDWTGDGIPELVTPFNHALYDGSGRRVATFLPPPPTQNNCSIALVGDYTGDGIPDVAITNPEPGREAVYLFENRQGARPKAPAPLGSGENVTLY